MKFLCDNTVGVLAKYLRMLGLDVAHFGDQYPAPNSKDDPDNPVLLTRKTKAVSYKPLLTVHANDISGQIREIEELIKPSIDPAEFLSRCIKCNTMLITVPKDTVETRVPEYVFHANSLFKLCPTCKKVYWHGTHAKRMSQWRRTLNGN
jgi:uncharacterized protein with PIN domain